jgi:hypothetical protein
MPDLARVTGCDLARRDCDAVETVFLWDCRVLGGEVINMNACRSRRPYRVLNNLWLEPSSHWPSTRHPDGPAIVPHARSDHEDRAGGPFHQEVHCITDARIGRTIAVRRTDDDQVEPVLFGMLR